MKYAFSTALWILFLLFLGVVSLPGEEVETYIDPYDIQYLRIQSLANQQYLYESPDNGEVMFGGKESDERNLQSHWFIRPATTTGEFWIINRLTGHAMNTTSRNDRIQAGPLEKFNRDFQWNINALVSGFRLTSVGLDGDQCLYLDTQEISPGPIGYSSCNAIEEVDQSQQFVFEPIPHGATLPWLNYDESNYASLQGGAELVVSDYNPDQWADSPASEARDLGCVLLDDAGASATWTVRETANAVNIRYSLKDGDSGTISLVLNRSGTGLETLKIPVSSQQAWVYFDNGTEYDEPAPGRIPAKRFADVHLLLETPISSGDTLTLLRDNSDAIIHIDVLELEKVERITPAAAPSEFNNVREAPWRATGDGHTDDTEAIRQCIADSAIDGKKVYLPPGIYRLREELVLPDKAFLQGAGMYYTSLFFYRSGSQSFGGIRGDGSAITLRDIFIKGSQITRSGGYKGIKGYWGTDSLIENVWVEETETGMWISDFDQPIDATAGLLVRGCRFRNTFADGINMSGGTRYAIVDNCHFRSAGDDALASWASDYQEKKGFTYGQRFRYNTIEQGFRAGGIGIFGGGEHLIHHNRVSEQFIGAGIRFSSIFMYNGSTQIGYPFITGSEPIRIYENTLVRTGTRDLFGNPIAAIDLQMLFADLADFRFEAITIDQSTCSGIRFHGIEAGLQPPPKYRSILLRDMHITNTPIGTRATGIARGSVQYLSVAVDGIEKEFDLVDGFTVEQIQNEAPVIRLKTPKKVYLAPGHGLLVEGSIIEDDQEDAPELTVSWTATEKPEGSTVAFDDPALLQTGVTFDRSGHYSLQLEVSDAQRTVSESLEVYYDLAPAFSGTDIGETGSAGSVLDDDGQLTLQGSGVDIWNYEDSFYFYALPVAGDVSIAARIKTQTRTDPWAKAGLMIRDSRNADSPHALIAVTPDNGLAVQRRLEFSAASLHTAAGEDEFPIRVRLDKIDEKVSAYYSLDGETWVKSGSAVPRLNEEILAGIAVTSHSAGVLSTVEMDQLTLSFSGLAPQLDTVAGMNLKVNEGAVVEIPVITAMGYFQVQAGDFQGRWEKRSGPGQVTFSNPYQMKTTMSADTSGSYVLRYILDDGSVSVFREFQLQVSEPTPLEAWLIENFGTTVFSREQYLEDPDQNGIVNLLEFLLGADPFSINSGMDKLPHTSWITTDEGEFLEFVFNRQAGIWEAGDLAANTSGIVQYHVQVSTDLILWTNLDPSVVDSKIAVSGEGLPETIVVHFPGPVNQTIFVRLAVELTDYWQ